MRVSLVSLALISLGSAGLHAQSIVQLGGGYTHTPDSALGVGGHALASYQVATGWDALRMRTDGFASASQWRNTPLSSIGGDSDAGSTGTHVLAGLGIGAQIERSSGIVDPYLFGTLDVYGERSPARSSRLVQGITGGVGASANWKGRQWFAELSARSFSAEWYSTATTWTTIWPLSVGLRF